MAKQEFKRLTELSVLPPATQAARKSKGEGTGLMIMVPTETLRALRLQAAQNGSTVRALVLVALSNAGYPVPADVSGKPVAFFPRG